RSISSSWIVNGTQWRAFRRWAIALGFATEAKGPSDRSRRLIPDATLAVSDSLPPAGLGLRARQFAQQLSARLPVIDGGALESVARDLGVRYDARGDAAFGPVVGYALERLEHRGWIRLKRGDDAAGRLSYRLGDVAKTFDEV